MKSKELLTEEQMDFLREMINIGAGSAVGAFSQMLMCTVAVKVPEIYFFPSSDIPSFLKEPAQSFAAVRMAMIGDVRGRLFLLIKDEQKCRLIELLEMAMPGGGGKGGVVADISAIEEMGNILAGVFLVTIHDFCRLNIYHTVPDLKTDMIQSLIDESVANAIGGSLQIIMIETEFVVTKENIGVYFLIIPSKESTQTLVNSIDNARKQLYEK